LKTGCWHFIDFPQNSPISRNSVTERFAWSANAPILTEKLTANLKCICILKIVRLGRYLHARIFSQLFSHPLFITDPPAQSQMLIQPNCGKGCPQHLESSTSSTPLAFKLELECYTWRKKDVYPKIDQRSSYMQHNMLIALANRTKQRAGYTQAAPLALSLVLGFS